MAIETHWSRCARPDLVFPAVAGRPRLAAVSLAALALGVAPAVLRYGAGPDRLSLAAIRAWSGPPELASGSTGWYYVPAVLVAYEPLTLLLGVVGMVFVVHRWRARGAGIRLAAVWALTGLALVILWLHRQPGQVLAATVPLVLLAGIATVALADRLERARGWRSWLPLAPLVAAAGYTVLLLARWADRRVVYADEAGSVLIIGVGALIAAHVGRWLARGAVVGPLLVVAWVVLGGMTLHAATAVAFRGGSEILTGIRTLPETAAIVARLDALDRAGGPVCIERRLWPALAWPLRGREVRTFAGTPPCYPAVVRVEGESEVGTAGSRGAVSVAERWSPSSVDGVGILRWWAFRNRWGPAARLQALVAARETEAVP